MSYCKEFLGPWGPLRLPLMPSRVVVVVSATILQCHLSLPPLRGGLGVHMQCILCTQNHGIAWRERERSERERAWFTVFIANVIKPVPDISFVCDLIKLLEKYSFQTFPCRVLNMRQLLSPLLVLIFHPSWQVQKLFPNVFKTFLRSNIT